MHREDETLHEAVRQSQPEYDVPAFASVFRAAEQQLRARRRIGFAGVGVAAVVALLALNLQPQQQQQEFIYLDVEELAASTNWSAPSDSLLPDHRVDIYREIPRLFESTEPDGGALL